MMATPHLSQDGKQPVHPAVLLAELGHRARRAGSVAELDFLLVNDSRLLAPFRQGGLWLKGEGIVALSGVVQVDRNTPYAQWMAKACAHLARTVAGDAALIVQSDSLPAELSTSWQEWLPQHVVWLPLHAQSAKGRVRLDGGLLLASQQVIGQEKLVLLGEWGKVWAHARCALMAGMRRTPIQWLRDNRSGWQARPWWRRPWLWLVMAVVVAMLWPVHLSVLAPGELVAVSPAVLRAPMDGVVAQIEVQPNERVKQGQLLFSLDEAQISSRLAVSEQSLATAEAEYRQIVQMALDDPRSKGQLAALVGRIGERKAEQAYLTEQLERARVVAPQDGMVLFDAPSEWIGRPVQTGERVMRIAQPDEVEIEGWLPIGDAIPLEAGAPARLYLATRPFSPVDGSLRYLGYDAESRPDGAYAYRLRATVRDSSGEARIGLKGTVKLEGRRVPLVYWVLRKPWATIRQFLAI